jgi:hypothetical protein
MNTAEMIRVAQVTETTHRREFSVVNDDSPRPVRVTYSIVDDRLYCTKHLTHDSCTCTSRVRLSGVVRGTTKEVRSEESAELTRLRRIVALVTAPGSSVMPSALNDGYVVVVDGRTQKDACEKSADAAFDVLFEEMDTGRSPRRFPERSRAENGAGEKSPVARPLPMPGSPAVAILGPEPTREEINARLADNEQRARRVGL